MVQWSVDVFRSWEMIDDIVVALPRGRKRAPKGTRGVPGGRTRAESVKAALAAVRWRAAPPTRAVAGHVKAPRGRLSRHLYDGDVPPWHGEYVFVHDAARPLIGPELLKVLFDLKHEADAVTAASPIADTLRRTSPDGLIVEDVDRAAMWAIETPQLFHRDVLSQALDVPRKVLAQATDETSLVRRAGGTVQVVSSDAAGHPRAPNLKVTWPNDLKLAEFFLARASGE
jgi:2-C-methyl-D-erythritol 4-phosphate cytidylyltransferase